MVMVIPSVLPIVTSTSLLQMEKILSVSFTSFKLHWLVGGRRSFFFPSDFDVLMGVGSAFIVV